MKRIVIVLLSISLFLTLSVSPTLAAAADSVIGTLVDCTFAGWSEVPEEARQLAQAYVDLFKSTSLKDTISCVEDIPISWLKTIGSVQYALSPASDIVYLLDESGVLEVENGHSSHGGRHRVGNEQDDVVVGGDQFKKHLDDHSTYYEPTGRINKISWKTDPIFSSSDFDYFRYNGLTFLYQGDFFKVSGLKDVYCALYYFDGTNYYYSQNGFHFYLDEWSDSSGGSGSSLFYDVYNFSEPADFTNDIQVFEDISAYPYIKFFNFFSTGGSYGGTNYNYSITGFKDLATFLKNRASGGGPDIWYNDEFSRYFVSSHDRYSLSEYLLIRNYKIFMYESDYRDGYNLSVNAVPCDWGFIYSDTKFTMDGFGADIDTTKIPDNYYITVSGDTIYDYSITNPETGQSSTVNEYITNNYTYITNNPGGDGGGSGTTGGNVSVGGNVGVNGNVNVGGEVKFGGEVKVNVNVSGAGESGNGGEDPPEIGAVDDLVDYLPEKSPAINEYLKIFFDTLPPELLGLILAGVAVAVIKLIFRR